MDQAVIGQQLILDVGLREACSFDNFVVGDNELLVEVLKRSVFSSDEEFCYCLYGAHGSGKTHLVGAVMDEYGKLGKRCVYYPMEDCKSLDPRSLSSELQPDLVCIDDLHKVLGDVSWECALFECYNRRQTMKLPMVITMLNSPQSSNFLLSDLRSRLMADLVFKVKPMSDSERLYCLQYRAKQRGLVLSATVARFLIERYTRDNHSLLAALDKLDFASIEKRRALTIPFVKQTLGI